jgi:hypothetical protein
VAVAASLVFLTPTAALLALVGAVPLGALALAARRARRAREALRLPGPPARRPLRPAGVAAVAALLGLAASQPVLRSTTTLRVRTDAQAFFVLDVSRSMLAARSPGGRTRIARARDDAIRLRQALLDVPSGVATLTDRVLPSLFPDADPAVFDATVRQAIRIDEPPASSSAIVATSLGALGALGTQNFFPPTVRHRVAIVLTDGESAPFDPRATARALAERPGLTPIFVRIGSPAEQVFGPGGQPERGYHPDPAAAQTLAGLAQQAHGAAFSERELGAAARAARAALGRGPTAAAGLATSTRALGPLAALAALLPLAALLADALRSAAGAARARVGRRRNPVPWRPSRRLRPRGAER